MKKKLIKVLSTIFLMVVILSTIQSTVFATSATPTTGATSAATPTVTATDVVTTPAAYGVEVALYLMESNNNWSWMGGQWKLPSDWSEPKSESVFIKEDGTYTLSLKDLDIPSENFMLCYIKDVSKYPKDSTVTHSNVPDDTMIITDVFKVNGMTKEVNASKVRTGLKDGIFDIAYRNNWDPNDDCVDFSTTVKSIDITFTVTGITGAPGAIKYEPTQAPTAAVTAAATADNTSNTTATSASSDGSSTDGTSVNYLTTIIICIASTAVLAVIAIILLKKKKK